jgi:nucleotide-binding universal stress UspA family protein
MAAGTATLIAHGIELKNIAVLTDLGSDAEKPLRFAAALAQGCGAKLTIAHACKADPYMFAPPEAMPSAPRASLSPDQAPDQAEEEIRALMSGAAMPQSMVNTVVSSSSITELLEQLILRKPDLLVLATHARSGVSKWLSGSVSEEAFRKANSPVMVLPPTLADTETSGKHFERILFTTDLSDGAAGALAYALGIAERNGGHLVALHVHPDASSFYFERIMALQRLEEWLHRQNLTHQQMAKIECIVRFGKTTDEIKAAAAQYQSELIVLGARGFGALSGLASHFVGGTAYHVACSSECPVLIVPDAA